MIMAELALDDLLTHLAQIGFVVSHAGKNSGLTTFSGHGVDGVIAAADSRAAVPALRGRVSAVHSKALKMWRTRPFSWAECPLSMRLPVDIEELLVHLQNMASDRALEVLDFWNDPDQNPFPRDA